MTKGKILALVLITTIILSLSPMLHLTPIKIASAQTENNSLPLCALKSEEDGYIYVPIMNPSEVKVEFWYATGSLDGDVAGGASPYSNLKNWPDAKIDGKDTGYIAGVFGVSETMQNWTIDCYLGDCVLDRKIDGKDLGEANGNFGHWGTYDTNMTGIYIIFQPSGTNSSLDGYGMFQIPLNDVNFTVYHYGSTVSAMTTFWFPRVPFEYYDWIWHFAPYFITFEKNLTADANQGNHTVSVINATWYEQAAIQQSYVKIWDDEASEWNMINNVNKTANTINVTWALINNYTTAKHAQIEAPDPNYGRRPYAASFALDFLCSAYNHVSDGRCPWATQMEIKDKIKAIMDWLTANQGTDDSKIYYGGFNSMPDTNGTSFWTFDAARGLVSSLHAYDITGRSTDLATGLRCVNFLGVMYYEPNDAFSRYINDAFDNPTFDHNAIVADGYAEYGLTIAQYYDSSLTLQCQNLIDETYTNYDIMTQYCYSEINDTSQAFEYAWNGTMHCLSTPDPVSFGILGVWKACGSLYGQSGADAAFDLTYATNCTTGYEAYNSTICWPCAYNMTTLVMSGNRFITRGATGESLIGPGLPYDLDEYWGPGRPYYAPVCIAAIHIYLNEYNGPEAYCNATKAGWMWTISHHITAFMDWGVDIPTLDCLTPYKHACECVASVAAFYVDY